MSDPDLPASPIRITLSGDLGSGKSSVGRRLAATLGVPYYSAGALFREIGQIDNLDALKTNLAAENNTAIDFAVDQRTREIDRTVPSFIVDSRMAWHFVRNALKVYLSVSRDTAAHRIMADQARAAETYVNHAAAVAALGDRRQSERKRYKQLYGVDITDLANYDLAVVTDDAAAADVADLVLAAAKGQVREKFWLPKSRLVPIMAWEELPAPRPGERRTDPLRPPPVTVLHNFGFFFGNRAELAAVLAAAGPFVPYRPEPPRGDGEAIVEHAKRVLTPGGLGRWTERHGVGAAFGRLLGPARP
jgi:predicted cytidylate kinase